MGRWEPALLCVSAAYAPASVKASLPASDLKLLTVHLTHSHWDLRLEGLQWSTGDKSRPDILYGPVCTPLVLALLVSGMLTMLFFFSSLYNFAVFVFPVFPFASRSSEVFFLLELFSWYIFFPISHLAVDLVVGSLILILSLPQLPEGNPVCITCGWLYDLVLGNVIQERFARSCWEGSFLLLRENDRKFYFSLQFEQGNTQQ